MEGYEGLGDASGLDTTPDLDFESPTGIPTADSSAYHVTIRRAVELLDLQLPVKEVNSILLTEVLMHTSTTSEHFLPFHEAVTDPVLQVWEKPASAPAVNRALAKRSCPAPGDPAFLSAHPTPESLVIQASCSAKGVSFPSTPADRDSKKLEQQAKKLFSSGSMALKSVNASCLLGRYIHALLVSAQKLMPYLSEDQRSDFREISVVLSKSYK